MPRRAADGTKMWIEKHNANDLLHRVQEKRQICTKRVNQHPTQREGAQTKDQAEET